MGKSLQTELTESRIVVENTKKHVFIQQRMSPLGYDMPKINEGEAYYQTVKRLQAEQEDRYSQKHTLSVNLDAGLKKAKGQFNRHAKIAGLAYEDDPGMLRKLKLQEKGNGTEKWIDRAVNFYTILLADSTQVNKYGLSTKELTQMHALSLSLLDMRNQQKVCKGEAEQATQEREQARKVLRQWMKDFRYVARHALKDQKQLLEVLGIAVKTGK